MSEDKQAILEIIRDRIKTQDGNYFQTLFWKVIRKKFPDLQCPKAPYDRGSDGHSYDGKIFFACYAPESYDSKLTIDKNNLDYSKFTQHFLITRQFEEWAFVIKDVITGDPHKCIAQLNQNGDGIKKKVLDLEYFISIVEEFSIEDLILTFNIPQGLIWEDSTLNPIILTESDIKDLILGIKDVIAGENSFNYLNQDEFSIPKRDMDAKNQLNNVSSEYYDNIITKSVLYHEQIRSFLIDPINIRLNDCYMSIISMLNNAYLTTMNDYVSIEEFFLKVNNLLVQKLRNELGYDKRKILTMLHYMYYNCDLGINTKKF